MMVYLSTSAVIYFVQGSRVYSSEHAAFLQFRDFFQKEGSFLFLFLIF